MDSTLDSFVASLKQTTSPERDALRALWFDGRDDFDAAHRIAQSMPDPEGAKIHAYLHRKEGDLSNARYWYARAGVRPVEGPLDAEWRSLVEYFMAR